MSLVQNIAAPVIGSRNSSISALGQALLRAFILDEASIPSVTCLDRGVLQAFDPLDTPFNWLTVELQEALKDDGGLVVSVDCLESLAIQISDINGHPFNRLTVATQEALKADGGSVTDINCLETLCKKIHDVST